MAPIKQISLALASALVSFGESFGDLDCTGSKCPSECACAKSKCADSVNKCLADATCSKGQSCALACACGDDACSEKCVKDNASPLALPVLLCIKSQCESEVAEQVQSGSLALTWSDCGDASTHGKVKDLEPKTLELGKDVTLTGSGSLDEDVADGTFEIDVKAGPLKQKFTGDVCQAKTFNLPLGVGTVKWDGLSCPIKSGTMSVPIDVQLSASLPASMAKADISASAVTKTGDKLLCMNIHAEKAANEGESFGDLDCTGSKCPSECACAKSKCADSVNKCLADATCSKGQSCALACACGDDACSEKCVKDNASPLALPVLLCIKSQCESEVAEQVHDLDCSGSKCPSECACAKSKCADSVNKCLADATCSKGQSCALACACGDDACSEKCVKDNASPLALPVLLCIKSQCESEVDFVTV